MLKKRIFVAIKISALLQEKAKEFKKHYQKLPIRWIEPKNLHVTLIPPWYEEDIESVIRSLKILKSDPFKIIFNQITIGPKRQPRLIWVTGFVPAKLMDLKSSIEKSLGKASEERPFMLHMTLARFDLEQMNSEIRSLDESILWTQEVSSFVLMESHLSPKGADYEVVKTFDF